MLKLINKAIDILTKVTRGLTAVSAICLAIMLLVNIIEVVGTKWFSWSLIGYLEITEQLMVLVTLLPIAYIALERGHIRITMVADRLNAIKRLTLEILGFVLGILVLAFCSWRAFAQMQYAMTTKLSTNTLFFPIWPTNLVIVIGFGLLFFTWLLILIKKIVTTFQTN